MLWLVCFIQCIQWPQKVTGVMEVGDFRLLHGCVILLLRDPQLAPQT